MGLETGNARPSLSETVSEDRRDSKALKWLSFKTVLRKRKRNLKRPIPNLTFEGRKERTDESAAEAA